MKKILISFVLIFTIIATFSSSVFAYYPATRTNNGFILETEPNDYPEDATMLWKTSTGIYSCTGGIPYIEDTDSYVYQCDTTRARTLSVYSSTPLRDTDAELYVCLIDLATDQILYEGSVPASGPLSANIKTFTAIAGHDYFINIGLQGSYDAIQEKLDYYVEHTTRNQGYTYTVRIQ